MKKKNSLLLISLFFSPTFGFSQSFKSVRFSRSLNEISGMVFYNDSTLIINNDSEIPSKLYFLNLKGEIIKEQEIPIQLNDFEAIAKHGDTLFLGDIGNNLNQRQDLKIVLFDLKTNRVISSMPIRYPQQKAFPPKRDSLYFDAEAMVYKDDSLLIFTKNRTKPFDSKSLVYYLNMENGQLLFIRTLQLEKSNWLRSSVTDACYQDEKLFLLTYKFVFVFNKQYQLIKKYKFARIIQREGIAVNHKGQIFISSERNRLLGGGKLSLIKTK